MAAEVLVLHNSLEHIGDGFEAPVKPTSSSGGGVGGGGGGGGGGSSGRKEFITQAAGLDGKPENKK